MGYFLLYESMLDTVLLARDKYLVGDQHTYHTMGANTCTSETRRIVVPR